jgi:tRNA A37 N6-isopentenylltransferase MiaA
MGLEDVWKKLESSTKTYIDSIGNVLSEKIKGFDTKHLKRAYEYLEFYKKKVSNFQNSFGNWADEKQKYLAELIDIKLREWESLIQCQFVVLTSC